MRKLIFFLFTIVILAACNPSKDIQQAGFVTLLGNDTLAVEQFTITDSTITTQVILRSPETQISTYVMEFGENDGIKNMVQTDHAPLVGFADEGATRRSITRVGDSLRVDILGEDGETNSYKAPYENGLLPFIDMVHWPFEVAFQRAVATGADTVQQPMLSGNRISDFVIASIEGDSMTLRHPYRGVMGVQVNNAGGIENLDAGLTTRKLKVNRVSDTDELDMNALADRFARNPVGELSGAVSAEFQFKDTNFRVDFGSPKKRGRELFGNIVPWGERWRTGANRATHFYTSSNLMFGDLEVPAGEYTLFTIPEQNGGTLIINKQTGQNGRTYDQSRDLGRIPMDITYKDDITEAFTITVEETESGGRLNLIWGNTIFSSDFSVK